MISFADLHCDTLFRCFENGVDLNSDDLHINKRHICTYKRYIQVFAHYIPEQIPDKWGYFKAFLHYSRNVLEKAEIPIFKTTDKDNLTQRRFAVLSVEGGDFFDSLKQAEDRISFLSGQGIALFSMIYNQRNTLGCGCAAKIDTGLTNLGKETISIFERNNIILDVSHASYKSTQDILSLSTRPVCATHSNAHALTAHRRNLSDVQLRAISNKGGLVGVNFYPPFLSTQAAGISDICRHIDHLVSVCGENNVSFGCDFDGVDQLPVGIENLSSLVCIYSQMKQLGYSETQLDKIFFNNVLEFLNDNFRR